MTSDDGEPSVSDQVNLISCTEMVMSQLYL